MTSINTNIAAQTALRTLQSTNMQLDQTQSRISTGLKIAEAKDNAAYWSISTALKSDNKAMGTVKDALGLGAATVDTAYQGLNAAKDVLDEIKSKLAAATQPGVNRQAIQAEISELQAQLRSIATSSTFSGENWLAVNSGTGGYSAEKSVVASFAKTLEGNVSIGTIGVDIGNLSLFDDNADAVTRGVLDQAMNLTKADGTTLSYGGSFLGNLSLGGLKAADVGVTSAVTATGAADVASITFNDDADAFTFTIAIDNKPATTVSVTRAMAVTASGGDGVVNTAAEWQQLMQAALNEAKIDVTVGVSGNRLTYTSASTGPDANVAVALGTFANGATNPALDGAAAAGVPTEAFDAGHAFTPARATMGEFTAPITLDRDDTISFELRRDGDAATTRVITINKALIDGATGRTDGRINNASEYATVLTAGLAAATTLAGARSAATGFTVSSVGNQVTIQSNTTSRGSNVTVSELTASAGATGSQDRLSIMDINITDASLRGRGAVDGAGQLDAAKVRDVLGAYITNVNKAIESITTAASNLGAVASRIELQQDFVSNLMDTIDAGVSGLIDADMNEESTRLQALQVKQQLGVQALSIANQSAQNVLSLFR